MTDPHPKARLRPVIRVFVSSTFSDMRQERNVPQEEVSPKLEQYCLRSGFQFQAVDLRWGISSEAGGRSSHDADMFRGTPPVAGGLSVTQLPDPADWRDIVYPALAVADYLLLVTGARIGNTQRTECRSFVARCRVLRLPIKERVVVLCLADSLPAAAIHPDLLESAVRSWHEIGRRVLLVPGGEGCRWARD